MKNETQSQNTQGHLFGKPLAITVFDNILIKEQSFVNIEIRVANVATEEVICTIKDDDVKKAESKAKLIVTAVNEYPSLKRKADMHDATIEFLNHFILENELRKNAGMPTNTKTLISLAEKLFEQAEQK